MDTNTIRAALIAVTATCPTLASAGEFEIGVAKGVMIYSIIQEKCTGNTYTKDHMAAQYKMLQAQGFSVKDIERGFHEGNLAGSYAFLTTKPTKTECKAARDMFGGTKGFLPF